MKIDLKGLFCVTRDPVRMLQIYVKLKINELIFPSIFIFDSKLKECNIVFYFNN